MHVKLCQPQWKLTAFIQPFRKSVHVYSLSEKVYCIWSFFAGHPFFRAHSKCSVLSGTQGFKRCSPTVGSIVYNETVLRLH